MAVVGPAEATAAEAGAAETVGRGLAQAGVDRLDRRPGRSDGRRLPGGGQRRRASPSDCYRELIAAAANQWLTIAIPTGLGELRNGLLVRAAEVVIAIGGAFGTLSEVALALKTGVPVVGLNTWAIEGISVRGRPRAARSALGLSSLG